MWNPQTSADAGFPPWCSSARPLPQLASVSVCFQAVLSSAMDGAGQRVAAFTTFTWHLDTDWSLKEEVEEACRVLTLNYETLEPYAEQNRFVMLNLCHPTLYGCVMPSAILVPV